MEIANKRHLRRPTIVVGGLDIGLTLNTILRRWHDQSRSICVSG